MSNDDLDKVWGLANKIGICMLCTHDGRAIRGRPMGAYVRREDGAIYFLTDAASAKDYEIERDANVALAFADVSDQKYVSIVGTARVSNDRQKIRELWSTPAKAWWDNPDDPSIRVLKVAPSEAQYWDSPGTVVSYVKMLAAAVSSARPDLGDQGKVKM